MNIEPKSADELLSMFNDFLETLPYERKPKTLYDPIVYTLSRGGKRIRPVLMLLTYNMFRSDPERILMQAAAIETYHNYTLLHDDLMDNADVRRGSPTVHKKWDANTAILSGDAMLVLAYQRLADCKFARCHTRGQQQSEPEPPRDDFSRFKQVLDLFTQTALEIGEGQQYDMDFEHRNDVTEEEYIEMIRLKTSVLLACSMKIGAILAGASNEDADTAYKFGERIGLAFQLQDDLLDVYGDPAVFGKAIGGDIVSNKKTYMLINALQRADKQQRETLESWISRDTFEHEEKIASITNIYDELGIRTLCQRKIDEYFNESEAYLDKVSVPENAKAQIRSYTANMMRREK